MSINGHFILRVMNLKASDAVSTRLGPFQLHLRERGLSVATVRAYLHDLKLFERWLSQIASPPVPLKKLGAADLGAYRSVLVKDGSLKPSTVNRRINALRAFFGWLQKGKVRMDNPSLKVRFVRRPTRRRPESLKRVEVLALVRAAADSPKGLSERNCALLQLMLQTGMRVGEVLALKWKDLTVRARSGSARIRAGQGTRELPLNATVRAALNSHQQTVPSASVEAYVFQSKPDSPLSVRAAQDIIASIAKRAKVTRIPVSTQSIRHTFATNFLQSNPGKLVDLSVLLGHESVNTTAVYLRASEDLALGVEGSGLNVFGE